MSTLNEIWHYFGIYYIIFCYIQTDNFFMFNWEEKGSRKRGLEGRGSITFISQIHARVL